MSDWGAALLWFFVSLNLAADVPKPEFHGGFGTLMACEQTAHKLMVTSRSLLVLAIDPTGASCFPAVPQELARR